MPARVIETELQRVLGRVGAVDTDHDGLVVGGQPGRSTNHDDRALRASGDAGADRAGQC